MVSKELFNLKSIAAFAALVLFVAGVAGFGVSAYSADMSGATVVARADDSGGNSGRRRHGPPPEAISACDQANDGDACFFTSPRGDEIEGTCGTVREGDFACMPLDGPPGRGGRGGPDDSQAPDDEQF